MNGLQSISEWKDYFDNPTGSILGVVNAAQSIGSVISLPVVGTLSDKIGRRWTGITGFLLGYVVCGFIIGGLYHKLTTEALPAFVVLYGLLQAFGHMGPGATIGLISCVKLWNSRTKSVLSW